ncbi:hypothetical protein V6N11_047298 [Hibiscus sabdariffa]|uniref:PGG domain-containing protein n=1 Tax=Hibiscus sabdariffa TaxID=183260 RepID=A0ABR1ZL46_9ROSI
MDHRLLMAVRSGDARLIKRLADEENGILSGTSSQGNTILHIAVKLGHWSAVEEIMKRDPKLSLIANHKGETAVHIASKGPDTIMAQSFIESVQKLEEDSSMGFRTARLTDHDGNTPVHCAVRKNSVSLMKRLAVGDSESLLLVNQAGESPINIALNFKLKCCIKAIISLNQSALEYKGPNDQTTLHLAVMRGDIDVVRIILKEKAHLVNSKDDKQRTPLHYAAALGQYYIAKELLRSSDISAACQEDQNNQIPLHLAAKNGNIHLLEALLNSHPNTIELVDKRQQNILHIAAQNGKLDIVLFVLDLPEMEDLLNAGDENGNTPLHLAAEKFYYSIVYILTKSKVLDIRAINKEGYTALDVVRSSEAREMRLVYKKHGTWAILKSAYATRAISLEDVVDREWKVDEELKRTLFQTIREECTAMLVVATLIATVTFAAAFTVPRGLITAGQMWNRIHIFDAMSQAIAWTCGALMTMVMAFTLGFFLVLFKDLELASLACIFLWIGLAVLLFNSPRLFLFMNRWLVAIKGRRSRRELKLRQIGFLFNCQNCDIKWRIFLYHYNVAYRIEKGNEDCGFLFKPVGSYHGCWHWLHYSSLSTLTILSSHNTTISTQSL